MERRRRSRLSSIIKLPEPINHGVVAGMLQMFRRAGIEGEDALITSESLQDANVALFLVIWRGLIPPVEEGMILKQVISDVCFYLDNREGD